MSARCLWHVEGTCTGHLQKDNHVEESLQKHMTLRYHHFVNRLALGYLW